MTYSQFFILSSRGDTIISKECTLVLSRPHITCESSTVSASHSGLGLFATLEACLPAIGGLCNEGVFACVVGGPTAGFRPR